MAASSYLGQLVARLVGTTAVLTPPHRPNFHRTFDPARTTKPIGSETPGQPGLVRSEPRDEIATAGRSLPSRTTPTVPSSPMASPVGLRPMMREPEPRATAQSKPMSDALADPMAAPASLPTETPRVEPGRQWTRDHQSERAEGASRSPLTETFSHDNQALEQSGEDQRVPHAAEGATTASADIEQPFQRRPDRAHSTPISVEPAGSLQPVPTPTIRLAAEPPTMQPRLASGRKVERTGPDVEIGSIEVVVVTPPPAQSARRISARAAAPALPSQLAHGFNSGIGLRQS